MEEEIEERLKERIKNIEIKVKYEKIRIYKIILTKRLPIESGLTTKTIIFYYDWLNNYTFDSNIEQLIYEIKSNCEREGIRNNGI